MILKKGLVGEEEKNPMKLQENGLFRLLQKMNPHRKTKEWV